MRVDFGMRMGKCTQFLSCKDEIKRHNFMEATQCIIIENHPPQSSESNSVHENVKTWKGIFN